jgi:hypothetical protein
MAIITSLSRGHGMALFLVLFNRIDVECRLLFPVRESPSALTGRAIILMSGWLFKRYFLFTLHLFESLDPFFWIFISPRCKASSRKTSFFLLHLSFF